MDTQAFIHTNRLILQKLNSEIQKELFEWRTEDERMSFFGFTSFEELQNQKERYEKA